MMSCARRPLIGPATFIYMASGSHAAIKYPCLCRRQRLRRQLVDKGFLRRDLLLWADDYVRTSLDRRPFPVATPDGLSSVSANGDVVVAWIKTAWENNC